ncbi:Mbeg1-like protein [Xylanimonas ulmi]|uniref:DUF2974 family protein n=1 Tax=Xylanimonas ulmi TaxID=228973 RepID=A0A4Q7LY17_9MICO|nr:Mbeg1-like protein [Xylanibacterium ulmi]RZS60025.1 DUF2974 family protein [Xylanibacterium ulmi]
MADVLDYLRWRGDVTLAERPFNIVDNLVISALAYLDLDGIVPGPGAGSISIRQAAVRATTHEHRGTDRRLDIVPATLLDDVARTARFADALLSDYRDDSDESLGMQFSALTIQLDDDTTYVTFRGTDNTIMGWREDFAMSFQVMPAQVEAASYLRAVAERTTTPLRVGGHSKGGNLAVYSAMLLPPEHQARLLDVHSNDGPGLSTDLIDRAGLNRISDRITKVVPEWALIGALFENDPPTHVVASDARGLLQHDIMSWQVERASLKEVAEISRRAGVLNGAIDEWLRDATVDDRRDFTNALFGALGAGGARLTTEIAHVDYGSVESVLVALMRSRPQTRRPVALALRVAARTLASADYRAIGRDNRTLRGVGSLALGIFFMALPSLAVQIVGATGVFILAVWGTVRVSRYVARFRTVHNLDWRFITAQALLLGLLLTLIPRLDVLVVPTNLLLGIAFLAHAWGSSRRAFRRWDERPRRRLQGILHLMSGVLATALGIFALTTAGHVQPAFVLQAGVYLSVVGTTEVLVSMRVDILPP